MVELDRLLDGVSTAQVNPDEVFPRLRDAFASLLKASGDAKLAEEAVYAALRNAVWTFVASGEKGSHLNRWADLILRVRQYLRVRQSAIAERLTTLADMMEKSVNSAEQSEKVKLGKHHLQVLSILKQCRGETARADLLKETGLKDSNLSHVLSKLAAARLIDRIPIGREATIRITEDGCRVLSDRQDLPVPPKELTPSLAWAQPDYALAVASSSIGLIRCNDAFASMFETSCDRLARMPVGTLRETLAAKIQYPDVELGEVTGADGRTRRLIEKEEGDHTYWIGFDVTAYRRKIDELRKRERALSSELADLRAVLAETKGLARAQDHLYPEFAPRYGLAGMMLEMTPDVMTPVSSIAAIARVLAASARLKGAERDYVSAIITNSDHLKNVLSGMIAVADADAAVQVAAPFRPNSIAREIADNFAVSARQHGYTIFVDSDEDREVFADGYAFKAALQNTVADVICSVPPGTSVGIRTTTDSSGVGVELVASHIDTTRFRLQPMAFARCEAYVRKFGARVDYAGYEDGVVRTKYHWPSEQRRRK
ncbi:hypothetical protein AYJ54_05370 [Bradyrhizobium centrolobii]|uniref:Uncharacterized protein n=1 Tax=Bradyrhizobium centrolobii TaxID=1505087 RepID=A0A176Z9P9_9BRAD|nr:hypothetical protein [Bradyrhizobium centrolobii]OAF16582.1 hypothetical protein AYJ54_05370 [Bradyrhizobium centrolobii]